MITHVGRRAVAASVAAAASPAPLQGFHEIKHAVARQFQKLSEHELFRVDVEKDALWDTYLSSFPPGTNPIFRTRTEHDCSCCRQFVRAVGNAVAIVDGALVSVWDFPIENNTYKAVAEAMSALVKSAVIDNRFLHTERTAGTDKNFEQRVEGVKTWEHFFVNIPQRFVCAGVDIGPRQSESRALHDVLLRSLETISTDAIDTVLDLIAQNSLYRGEEHKHAVTTFKELKKTFLRVPLDEKDAFAWISSAGSVPASVSKIRNTSIGTLLVDLSEGRDMEAAVRSFEAMVAPANYKRPTALVTPAMVAKAKETLTTLGLTSALDRRYATLRDISINDVLFADRSAKKVMTGDVFDGLATASKRPDFSKVEQIGVEKFLTDVLPKADSVEMLVENRLTGNLVSLIAPADPTAGLLFKWPNRFSWSYNGDFADSIKERVKKAGGSVVGDLCCRLAWSNFDDLDFHMQEPTGGHIYYGTRGLVSSCGGMLDVDMNAGVGSTREPVENIYYPRSGSMREGVYTLFVNQFKPREATNVGFEAEIDIKGAVYRFAYSRALKRGENVLVARFRYTHAGGLEIIESLPASTATRKVWNVDTESFHKVNLALLSPNHWSAAVGNKHYFFMLDGCQNDGTARGFYNEFLKGELDQHRKVFELVGAKMRTDETADQLSGLGFSSTQRNHAIVRVKGAFTRTLQVNF